MASIEKEMFSLVTSHAKSMVGIFASIHFVEIFALDNCSLMFTFYSVGHFLSGSLYAQVPTPHQA